MLVKQGFGGYPAATIAFCGPTAELVAKVVVRGRATFRGTAFPSTGLVNRLALSQPKVRALNKKNNFRVMMLSIEEDPQDIVESISRPHGAWCVRD